LTCKLFGNFLQCGAAESSELQCAGPKLTKGSAEMTESERWRHMSSAPKDGTRILVTVRSVEQGPVDIDVAFWARADKFGMEGWRAADSSPGCVIGYAEAELRCWMPMPGAGTARAAPAPWEGDEKELHGSGI
jgi:hypothetical protein